MKWSEVAQSCPTLCDPMDCSLPGSSIHQIFQARILKWVAISFSRRTFQPRDWTQVSHIVGRRFTIWATREAQPMYTYILKAIFLAIHVLCCVKLLQSCPTLTAPWTVAWQASLSMGFSRQEYWSELSFLTPGYPSTYVLN